MLIYGLKHSLGARLLCALRHLVYKLNTDDPFKFIYIFNKALHLLND